VPATCRIDIETALPRILVVQRLPLVRDALSALLTSKGFSVSGATCNFAQALNLIAKQDIDITLIDAATEVELLIQLRQHISESNRGTKVALLDFVLNNVHLRHAQQVKASGYLTMESGAATMMCSLRRLNNGERVVCNETSAILPDTIQDDLSGRYGASSLNLLTRSELELVPYLARGLTVRETARLIGRATSTVDNHKARLMKKLGIHCVAELTRVAIREGILD